MTFMLDYVPEFSVIINQLMSVYSLYLCQQSVYLLVDRYQNGNLLAFLLLA